MPLFVALGSVGLIVLLLVACLGVRAFLSDDPDPTGDSGSLPQQTAAAGKSEPGGTGGTGATDKPGETGDGKQSGTLITTYDVAIVGGYSIPLGDTAPTQAQFDEGCKSGDLCRNGSLGAFFPVGPAVKMYGIAGHLPPTYAGCKNTTLSADRMALSVGQTFCVLKNGRVIGVTIVSVPNSGSQPVKITASVWADWPGSTPIAEPAPSGPAPGTQVATYSVTMVGGSIALTDAKPESTQIDPDCFSGDLCKNRSLGALFPVSIAVKLYNLAANTPATYEACTTTTLNAERIGFNALGVGNSFCVLRPGRVIGVTFTSMGRSVDDPLVMTITLWAAALK